jgi:hypothetical protein
MSRLLLANGTESSWRLGWSEKELLDSTLKDDKLAVREYPLDIEGYLVLSQPSHDGSNA